MKDIEMMCPKCGNQYTLGKDGVYAGCDKCLNLKRNAAGMIVYSIPSGESILRKTLREEKTREQRS